LVKTLWKRTIKSLQGPQGFFLINAEGIGLDHSHIPTNWSVLNGNSRPTCQLEKISRDKGADHKPPGWLKLMQST
jgi:hypothetical protein